MDREFVYNGVTVLFQETKDKNKKALYIANTRINGILDQIKSYNEEECISAVKRHIDTTRAYLEGQSIIKKWLKDV